MGKPLTDNHLKKDAYFVYIIECKDGSFYTGITTDIKRRFNEHKNKQGRHYTSSKKITGVVFSETHPNRSSALKRESEIKSWKRKKKLNLINGQSVKKQTAYL